MLEVNLFDENFRQSVCSVAFAVPETISYVRDNRAYPGITMFTDGYVIDGLPESVRSRYKIGWLHEPQCLHARNYLPERLSDTGLDLILTYYKPLLELPGFAFAPYGGIWINRKDWYITSKTKKLSMLFGLKRSTEGHRIRHEISESISSKDIDYYGFKGKATNYSAETKLMVHGDYSFSIVSETCREDNLFTEILLDCFIVGTVPIFWGCPNIGDYFNADGILSFETVDELKDIVSELSPEMYISMKKAILDNFFTAQKYAITEDWIFYNVLLGEFA